MDKNAKDECQFFINFDRKILFEAGTFDLPSALFVLTGVHFAFNIRYKESQKLLYIFWKSFAWALSLANIAKCSLAEVKLCLSL